MFFCVFFPLLIFPSFHLDQSLSNDEAFPKYKCIHFLFITASFFFIVAMWTHRRDSDSRPLVYSNRFLETNLISSLSLSLSLSLCHLLTRCFLANGFAMDQTRWSHRRMSTTHSIAKSTAPFQALRNIKWFCELLVSSMRLSFILNSFFVYFTQKKNCLLIEANLCFRFKLTTIWLFIQY